MFEYVLQILYQPLLFAVRLYFDIKNENLFSVNRVIMTLLPEKAVTERLSHIYTTVIVFMFETTESTVQGT